VRTETDAELVGRALSGDRTAFGLLVERHRGLLRGVVLRLVRDPGLADDAVQDAIVTALVGLERLRDPASFGPWLAGIGLNTGRRLLRGRRPDSSLDDLLGGTDGGWPADASPSPEAVVEAGEAAARVVAAVGALPPGQARAVASFYLAGMSYAETAEHLGVPVGAVRTRLHKARRTLRTALAELGGATTGRKDDEVDQSQSRSQDEPRVRLRIDDVRRVPGPDGEPRHIVMLSAVDGEGSLAVWIGPHEATSLAIFLADVELPRPSTYRMTAALLAAADATVREVTITDLVDGVFIARLVTGSGRAVDARPSDALNLALVLDVPIHTVPRVLELSRERLAREPVPGGDGHQTLAAEATAALAALVIDP
jgi:RNA polymerase sigma-70 factor (ECF subfamily)